MIRLRPRPLAVLALVATTLLTGCSNETPAALPAPSGTPSATPTETTEPAAQAPAGAPTPSSTVTRDLPVPEMDERATDFSQEGADSFARYYLDVLNYSRNSGDVELMLSISDPACTGCEYDVQDVENFMDLGYSHVGLETQFKGTWPLEWSPEAGEMHMVVYVDRPAHVVVDRDGQEIDQVEEMTEGSFYLWLNWIDGRWVVRESE